MSLYSVVRIANLSNKFVVKNEWIEEMNTTNTKRYGCRRTKQKKKNYSPNSIESPRFLLPVKENFDATKVACYKGNVMKTFGMIGKKLCAFAEITI